jgi:hypothetical protein
MFILILGVCMKTIFKLGAIAIVLVAIFSGCRSAAVYNVNQNPVTTKQSTTDDQLFKAIKLAGLNLGWQVSKVKPGLAQAQIFLRDHMALVEIPYTKEDFSIIYKDSTNLNYDPEKGTIHKNYNGWIQNLRSAIALQMSALDM